jgi:hypothetical protein
MFQTRQIRNRHPESLRRRSARSNVASNELRPKPSDDHDGRVEPADEQRAHAGGLRLKPGLDSGRLRTPNP